MERQSQRQRCHRYFDDIQWRIQDVPDGERQPLVLKRNPLFGKIFAENCMKVKEIGPGGARP